VQSAPQQQDGRDSKDRRDSKHGSKHGSHSKHGGQHRAPARKYRKLMIMGAITPVLALAGGVLAYQAQAAPQQLDPVVSSLAAYHLRTLPSANALIRQSAKPPAGQPAGRAGHSGTAKKRAARQRSAHTSHSSTASPATTTLSCSGTGGTGMLPYNYATIVSFLAGHGYTDLAAAGIAGNIYQESDGNPESIGSGGGGLIGWTPLPAGFVTGNVSADLQTQLSALLSYNEGWAQYIPLLNAATSAIDAAYIYMTYFERPGLPAAANREGAAAAVAQACGIS